MTKNVASWELGADQFANSLESLERMQQSVFANLEPMKALCQHIRTLPYAFAPLRAFEQGLGELAEAFAPMKELHEAVAVIAEDSSTTFTQLAKSLKVMHESRQRLVELESTFDSASEIEAEFNKFAQTLSNPSPKTSTARAGAETNGCGK